MQLRMEHLEVSHDGGSSIGGPAKNAACSQNANDSGIRAIPSPGAYNEDAQNAPYAWQQYSC